MGLALIKPFFDRVWSNPQTALVRVPGLKEDTELSLMSEQVDEIEEQMPYLEEIPLLDREGRITRVLTKNPRQVESNDFPWHSVDFMPSKVTKLDKIYISSLEHPDLKAFYSVWQRRLPLELLNNNNISEALKGEESLLIYGADVYPPCNKMSIWDFQNMIFHHWVDKKRDWVIFSEDFATIWEKNLHHTAEIVRLFDKGHQSVAVIDEDGNFKGVVLTTTFAGDFPGHHPRCWSNIFINSHDNVEQAKKEALALCFGTARREIHVLQNGRVAGAYRLCATSVEDIMKREPFFPPLHWELIAQETVGQFFGKHKKVLISSVNGDLRGFKENFSGILDVITFEDDKLDSFLSGAYDVLICGTDVWPNSYALKYTARELYADMLSLQLADYLKKHHVDYWYLSVARPPLNAVVRRGKGNRTESWTLWEMGDVSLGYYVHGEGESFSKGIRRTVGNPKNYKRSVFFYGPCTAEGANVDSQYTIESLLQKHLNEDNMSLRVVNCACAGPDYDINSLHRIIDTDFHEGDVIVQIGRQLTKKSVIAMRGRMFHTDDIFDLHSVQQRKVYVDNSSVHLTAEGNKIVAGYLFERLKSDLKKNIKGRKPVPSFVSHMGFK